MLGQPIEVPDITVQYFDEWIYLISNESQMMFTFDSTPFQNEPIMSYILWLNKICIFICKISRHVSNASSWSRSSRKNRVYLLDLLNIDG